MSDNAVQSTDGQARKPVLITGAAGTIGSCFAQAYHESYDLRLMVQDQSQREKVCAYGRAVVGDLTDLDSLKRACEGMSVVVHLAADPNPRATWASLLPNNILGTYNLFSAAKAMGVQRVIYASSIHAVSAYDPEVQVKADDPVNPDDLYGVSKCFGEALGRYMAQREGLSVICVRIGDYQPVSKVRQAASHRMLDSFVSPRDLNQMFQRCIDHPTLPFAIFHGLSNNRFKCLDISNARQTLGYAPQDDPTNLDPT